MDDLIQRSVDLAVRPLHHNGMDDRRTDSRSESTALPLLIAVLLLAIVILAGGAVGLGFVQFRSREYQMMLDAQRAQQAARAALQAAELERLRQQELADEAKAEADE